MIPRIYWMYGGRITFYDPFFSPGKGKVHPSHPYVKISNLITFPPNYHTSIFPKQNHQKQLKYIGFYLRTNPVKSIHTAVFVNTNM